MWYKHEKKTLLKQFYNQKTYAHGISICDGYNTSLDMLNSFIVCMFCNISQFWILFDCKKTLNNSFRRHMFLYIVHGLCYNLALQLLL